MSSSKTTGTASRRSTHGGIVGVPGGGCRIGELFAMLGRPRMLDLLNAFRTARGRPIRFRDLQARLGLSPKTLSFRLRTLVEAGFLTRRAYNEIPPRVEYEPTHKVTDLLPLFETLELWASRNTMTAVPVVSTVGRVRPVRYPRPPGRPALRAHRRST